MEKLKLIELLSEEEKKTIFNIVDAFNGRKTKRCSGECPACCEVIRLSY